jgi:hypothetical protein
MAVVYNICDDSVAARADVVPPVLLEPMSDDLPDWLLDTIRGPHASRCRLYGDTESTTWTGNLAEVWNDLSVETKLACVLTSLREKFRD